MGAISFRQRLTAVCFASLMFAAAPASIADVYNYDGLVEVATGAFSALTPAGSGLSGTITITPTPGGTSVNTADLTEALLKMTAADDGRTLFCFNYNVDCEVGEVSVPVTAITGLNLTFAANGCPTSGTIDLLAFSPTFMVNIPITLDLGAQDFFADGDALGTVAGIGGLDCVGGAPEIEPSPNPATPIDFGSVTTADAPQTQDIVITNSGEAALNVGTVAISGASDYTVTTDTCSGMAVSPSGGMCGITVTFTPATVGMPAATLTIPSDDADENPVTYSFSAAVALPPGEIATDQPLAIADTVAGEVMTGDVTVTNSGAGPLTITSIETTNPLAAPFSVTFDSCSTMTLAPMDMCTITVQFAPGTDGLFMDSFNIDSDDPVNGSITVNVSATALPPPAPVLSAAPNPLNLPAAMVTETSTGILTITNDGDADLLVSGLSGLVAPFSVMSETCTAGAVVPMATCTVTVEFAPTAEGMFTGTLMIASNDADSPASVTVNATGTMLLVPDIDVSPTTLTFTSQLFGDSEDLMATVSNMGTADLAITDIAIAPTGEFTSADDCPATLIPAATCTITVTFAPMTAGPLTATLTITSDSPGEEMTDIALSGTGIEPAPDIALDTTSLDLGMVTLVDDPAATADVTVTNNGTADLNVSSVTIPAGDFSVDAETCTAAALVPLASCTVTVAFLPTVVGLLADTLTIVSDDPDSPMVTVDLSGEGLMTPEPNIEASPVTLDLGTALWTQSPPSQDITITNSGNADLTIATVGITGTDAGSFMQTSDCVGLVAQAATCTITVTFTAAAPAGGKSATVEIVSDDPDTMTLMVPLTATSEEPFPTIVVTPATVAFGIVDAGTTTMQDVTVTNTGDADLNVGTISFATGAVYSQTNTCAAPVAPAASCTITVTFAPTAGVDTTYADTLSIASDDPDTPVMMRTITGEGATVPTPNISSDLAALDLGMVFLTTSSTPGTITITNNGTADLTISGISIIGGDAASFANTSDCPVMAPLAISASCTVNVTFTPLSVGALTATLQITSDDPDGSPFDIPLTGTGLATFPDISVAPAALDLGPVTVGMSAMGTVTVTNTGLADLTITSIVLAGPAAGFSLADDCGVVPASGGSCTVTVSFAPLTTGPLADTITINSDDPDSPAVMIALSGIGVAAPEPDIASDVASLDFGTVLIGDTSDLTATITNNGDAVLNIAAVAIAGTDDAEFDSVDDCVGMLAMMASCTVTVTFTPMLPEGMKTATLSITSDDPDTASLDIPLSGTADAPAPMATFSATALILPTVEEGMTSTGSITVTNTGDGDLVVSGIGTGDTIDAPFSLASETCTAAPIPNLGTCVMNFEFNSATVGDFMETFNFDSNDATPSRILSLEGSATMMPVPDIAVDVTTLDLGTLLFGDIASLSVTVTNNGGADLTITGASIAPAGDFTSMSTCGVVMPMATCTVTVTYAPSVAGAAAATLTITSDDPDTPSVDVALSGVGVMPVPEITVTPLLANFDSVVVGDSSMVSITVGNEGMANLNFGFIVISGAGAGEFSRDHDCFSIPSGDTCTVTVTFAPTVAGVASATLSINSDDADEGTVEIPLIGIATAAPMPMISVPASANVGDVGVGMTGLAEFAVTNSGTADLTVSGVNASGTGFAVSAETCTGAPVASMASCTVTVSFMPTAAGAGTGSISITSDDGANPVVEVVTIGNGTTAPMGSVSVTDIDFQNVTIGANSTQSITISNGGSGVLTVTGVTLSGANAADFNAPNTCVTISAGSSCDLMVTYSPSAAGSASATLTITTDDPVLNVIIVSLAAQGALIEEVIVAVTNEGKGSFGWLDLLALGIVVGLVRRRRLLALLCGTGLLASPVIAQELPEAGYWYAGAGIGSSTGQASEGSVRTGIEAAGVTVDSLSFDDSDSGWQAFVGYQATARFGVEVGYADLGEAGIDLRLGSVTIDQLPLISRTISENISFLGDGIRGSLIFKQPIGERASLTARVGLIAWEISSGISGLAGPDAISISEVESGTDFTYGFGGEVWFGPGKVGVRAEWERFEFGDQDAEMWSINGLFRF